MKVLSLTSRGVYFTPQVQYKLKAIACTYHVTLKSLVPALLWYIAENNKRYASSSVLPGPLKLKHVDISDDIFDRLKIQACQHHLPFSHYINIALLDTFDEPYSDDTEERFVKYFYEEIIRKYQENLTNARQCG